MRTSHSTNNNNNNFLMKTLRCQSVGCSDWLQVISQVNHLNSDLSCSSTHHDPRLAAVGELGELGELGRRPDALLVSGRLTERCLTNWSVTSEPLSASAGG